MNKGLGRNTDMLIWRESLAAMADDETETGVDISFAEQLEADREVRASAQCLGLAILLSCFVVGLVLGLVLR